jgi:hypothetical protein
MASALPSTKSPLILLEGAVLVLACLSILGLRWTAVQSSATWITKYENTRGVFRFQLQAQAILLMYCR